MQRNNVQFLPGTATYVYLHVHSFIHYIYTCTPSSFLLLIPHTLMCCHSFLLSLDPSPLLSLPPHSHTVFLSKGRLSAGCCSHSHCPPYSLSLTHHCLPLQRRLVQHKIIESLSLFYVYMVFSLLDKVFETHSPTDS